MKRGIYNSSPKVWERVLAIFSIYRTHVNLNTIKGKGCIYIRYTPCLFLLIYIYYLFYCKNEISTPAATAEPITPEILLDIQ